MTEYAIVLRFGSPVRVVTTPGLGIKLPFPFDRVVRFDRRLLVFDLPAPDEPARELLTRDKKNIEVQSYACWRVQDPLRFLQTVGGRDGAESYLRDIVVSELGQQLGRHDLSALISVNPADLRLAEIAGAVRDACGTAAARECGVEIVDFRVKRINLPEQNRESVFERMRAERKQIATRYRSEGEQRASAIRADADRQRMEILSEAKRRGAPDPGPGRGRGGARVQPGLREEPRVLRVPPHALLLREDDDRPHHHPPAAGDGVPEALHRPAACRACRSGDGRPANRPPAGPEPTAALRAGGSVPDAGYGAGGEPSRERACSGRSPATERHLAGRKAWRLVLLPLAVWLLTGFYSVGSNERGIVLRFGRRWRAPGRACTGRCRGRWTGSTTPTPPRCSGSRSGSGSSAGSSTPRRTPAVPTCSPATRTS